MRLRPRPAEMEGVKPEAAQHISAQEYIEFARQAGFTDIQHHEVEVMLDQELWEAICDYGPFARGALHYRYPAEIACPAMRSAIRQIFSDPDWKDKYSGVELDGRKIIPRRWLWVMARKP